MPKHILLDTNVLLHDPKAMFNFPDAEVLIPIEVIEEIDSFKRDMTELGRNSRHVAQVLDGLRAKGQLGAGIPLERNSTLRVICDARSFQPEGRGRRDQLRPDNRILAIALELSHAPDADTVIVTKNINLRLKADALGIRAQDYDVDRSPDADMYTGWYTVELEPAQVAEALKGMPVDLDFPGLPNEYALLRGRGQEKPCALTRFGKLPNRVYPLADQREGAAGIKPLNLEQGFALDALLDDRIKLVTLTGKAGTGKTLLAIAAGLRKVFSEDQYNRLLIFRPTTPVGRDIGFLPGDIAEKMRPWMQPIYDALELIREQDKRATNRMLPPDILECEEISIEPLTFIRGRSIPNQFIIIDEAQNLTPLEVKTVITRVGNGTKIILTGDPHQIDNPYVDSLSNGLVYILNRLRGSTISAHVGLQKGERSELAEVAANLL
ncbi:MAG: PhoH family protein [Lentisphaeria bacterium]|jgi:PhoH-like ATPase